MTNIIKSKVVWETLTLGCIANPLFFIQYVEKFSVFPYNNVCIPIYFRIFILKIHQFWKESFDI